MTDTTTFSPVRVTPASPARVDKLPNLAQPATAKAAPSPQARPEASRARLRGALMVIARPPKHPRSGNGLIDKLTDMVQDVPGVALMFDTAKGWWKKNGETTKTAGQACQALVTPIARRHPTGVLGISAAIGALLVLLKPWRLLLRPTCC